MSRAVRFSLEDWFLAGPAEGAGKQLVNHHLSLLDPQTRQVFFDYSLSRLPDPFSLNDLESVSGQLASALLAKEKVMVVGDYDVDGVTSTALMLRFFIACGFQVDWLIPNRFTEGYGLNEQVTQRILVRKPDWVVTVDNGITAKGAVKALKEAGVQVVVTDHHLPVPGKIPDCPILNPKLDLNHAFEEPNLSGVGVAFLLLLGIRKQLRQRGFWNHSKEPNLLESLDLVALGTVADQVPLIGINRLLAHQGLEQMRRRITEPNGATPGGTYLQTFQKDQGFSFINTETLGFRLGPLINAAGRMQDASLAVSFLLESDLKKSLGRLQDLQRCNQQRKKKQAHMVSKASELITETNPVALVLVDPSFHEGLVGIVAARLSEQYGCPTLVGTLSEQGLIKCSGRAKQGNLTELLAPLDDLLLGYGGHAAAAGCQFRPEDLAKVRQRFCQAAAGIKQEITGVKADYQLEASMLSLDFVHQLKQLEPFGQGNPKPLFWLDSLKLTDPWPMGTNHLKWPLKPGVDFIRWEGAKEKMEPGTYQVAFSLSENHYRGRTSLQGIIEWYHQVG